MSGEKMNRLYLHREEPSASLIVSREPHVAPHNDSTCTFPPVIGVCTLCSSPSSFLSNMQLGRDRTMSSNLRGDALSHTAALSRQSRLPDETLGEVEEGRVKEGGWRESTYGRDREMEGWVGGLGGGGGPGTEKQ